MINIFWNIFELAVNIFEAANVMYFICTFLNGHIRHKGEYRYWIIGSLVYATTTTVLNTILGYFVIYICYNSISLFTIIFKWYYFAKAFHICFSISLSYASIYHYHEFSNICCQSTFNSSLF